MEFRYLGNSGLKVSELTYGNWLTHASQVENDIAVKCVKTAIEVGITSFDTADVYANTGAEKILGKALKGERRESLEIFTKVYWPTGPRGHNDSGLSRKHILEAIDGSLRRLKTDYVDLYQAHTMTRKRPSKRRCRRSLTSSARARPSISEYRSGTPSNCGPAIPSRSSLASS